MAATVVENTKLHNCVTEHSLCKESGGPKSSAVTLICDIYLSTRATDVSDEAHKANIPVRKKHSLKLNKHMPLKLHAFLSLKAKGQVCITAMLSLGKDDQVETP